MKCVPLDRVPRLAPVALLVAARASAQVVTEEPIPAEFPPLIVEAEAGEGGADFEHRVEADAAFVSVAPSDPTAPAPATEGRVLSYRIEFPAPGEYELYVRFRVGPGGASDDSLFYGSGFGIKDPANEADWVTANGLSAVGYGAPEMLVGGSIGLPLDPGFRWVNLSEYDGGEVPLRFSVAGGELVQTLQLGAREDGLAIDKLALVASAVSQTVAELDAGLPGAILPPAPPPRTCVPRGPALAEHHTKFLGGVHSAAQAPNFAAYFNQVTPENAGKWGSVEAERDVMNWTGLDAAYELARAGGFPFRMHVMIWGNQQPSWIETLPPDEQLEEIEEWFAAVAERYPDLDMVEVVNEPLHDPPTQPGSGGGNYAEALGGAGATGWAWVVNAFRMGRRYFPTSELMLNDYSILNTPPDLLRYREIIALLQAEDLIDAIGVQGHAFSTRGPAAALAESLDSLGEMGLPIYITEMDVDGPTDEVQLADYQRLFPTFWEHPAVAGITLWGYRPGHWRTAQGAFLALESGAERPALVWLREYLESPAFTPVPRGQQFEVSESAAAGESVGVVEANGSVPSRWLILGGSGEGLFEIDSGSGEIRVAEGAVLDAELTPALTLEVVARDECSSTPVTVRVEPPPNAAPRVPGGQSLPMDADLLVRGSVAASDPDGDAPFLSIVGGDGAGLFALDPESGEVRLEGTPRFDVGQYTLLVTASDGRLESSPAVVHVTLPAAVRVCIARHGQLVPRPLVPLLSKLGASVGACATGTASAEPLQRWVGSLLAGLD